MLKAWLEKLFGAASVEDFEQSAHFWFQAALIVAAITFVFFFCAGLVVLAQKDADASQRVAQSFAPFFVGWIAAVTFCGAVWRGKITSEQSKQQRRQNDAKDEENLGKLLIDGTKLLGETAESHVLAGIAALQTVASSQAQTFSTSAMDILVDIVEKKYRKEQEMTVYLAARRAVSAGALAGNSSTRSITLDIGGSRSVPKIEGVRMLTVVNGEISPLSYTRLSELKMFGMRNVRLRRAVIGREAKNIRDCVFTQCKIQSFYTAFIMANDFIECDFSGAEFTSVTRLSEGAREKFASLLDKGNYYVAGEPIISGAVIDWSPYFAVKHRRGRYHIIEGELPAPTRNDED